MLVYASEQYLKFFNLENYEYYQSIKIDCQPKKIEVVENLIIINGLFTMRVFDIILNRTVFVVRSQGTVSRDLYLLSKNEEESQKIHNKRPKNQKVYVKMNGTRHEITQAWADPRYNIV